MHPLEREVLAALERLDRAVAEIRSNRAQPDLQPLFAQLDALAGLLPKGTDPNLLHYLRKKSYEKARLLLLGRDFENQRGTCDRS